MTTMTTRGRVMRICWIGCTLSAGFSSSVRHRGFRMPITLKARQQTDPHLLHQLQGPVKRTLLSVEICVSV